MRKRDLRIKRKKRIRNKIFGTDKKPRISVYRSNKHIHVQVIDDEKGVTLASFSDLKLSSSDRGREKVEVAKLVGTRLGAMLAKAKISQVVFDRAGYRYHGRIKALAEGIREGGIKF